MIGGPALVPSDHNDRGPRTSLTLAEGIQLRKAFRSGVRAAILANRFGVSVRTVYRYLVEPSYRCRECGREFVRRYDVMQHAVENVVIGRPAAVPVAAEVPPDFATHVSDQLRRRRMRAGLLAYETEIPIETIEAIIAGSLCPDRQTWMRICVVIGTPAQVAARREWAPVVIPRSDLASFAPNVPGASSTRR